MPVPTDDNEAAVYRTKSGTWGIYYQSDLYHEIRAKMSFKELKSECKRLGASWGLVASGTDEDMVYFIAVKKGLVKER